MIFLDVSTHTFLSIMTLELEFLGPRVIWRFLKKIYQDTVDRTTQNQTDLTGSHLPLSLAWDLVQTPVFPHWQVDFPGCSCKGTLLDPLCPFLSLQSYFKKVSTHPIPKSLLPLSPTLPPGLCPQHGPASQPFSSHFPPGCLAAGAENLPVDTGVPGVMGLWPLALPSQTLLLVQSPLSKPHVCYQAHGSDLGLALG